MRRLIVAIALAAWLPSTALAEQPAAVQLPDHGGPQSQCVPTAGNPTLEEDERNSEPPPLPNGQPSPPSKPLCPPGQVLIVKSQGPKKNSRPPHRVPILGHVFLSPPHHAPIKRSVEVSIFRFGYFIRTVRTKRDGSFTLRPLFPGDYIFRVRPTRKPFCHATAVGVSGWRGQAVRVRISVPTSKEHRCGPEGVNTSVNMTHTAPLHRQGANPRS